MILFLLQYKFDDKDLVHNVVQYYNISHRVQYSMVYQSLDRSVYVYNKLVVVQYFHIPHLMAYFLSGTFDFFACSEMANSLITLI